MDFLFTSECVSEGHPDKLADLVTDAIVDACLAQDADSKVACEACLRNGMVMVFGEVTTKAKVDYEAAVRETCKELGYDTPEAGFDYRSMEVLNKLEAQSPDIAQAVHGHFTRADEDLCAGDQGTVFGYATDETPECMPLSQQLASQLCRRFSQVRGDCPWLMPEASAQVTVAYARREDGGLRPLRIASVSLAVRSAHADAELLRMEVLERVVRPTCPAELVDDETVYRVASLGAPVAGLSGRQAASDTYGGWGGHGGGALSGKDCTKPSRSAAYATRWAAKSLVKAGLCARCSVQVSFGIGLLQPLAVQVDSHGSAKFGLGDDWLSQIVRRHFDFRPGSMIRDLNLKVPRFKQFGSYGHFGRVDFNPEWEIPKDLSSEIPIDC